jgi:hypothetical protein
MQPGLEAPGCSPRMVRPNLEHWEPHSSRLGAARPEHGRSTPITGRRRAAWLAAAFLACSGPVWANDDPSSSSASIDISVSVASRHWLEASDQPAPSIGSKRSGTARFCIGTNGRAMELPVMLVWTPSLGGAEGNGPTAERRAVLAGCSARNAMTIISGGLESNTVIVRPE